MRLKTLLPLGTLIQSKLDNLVPISYTFYECNLQQ
jgi:hypothetical protein